MAARSGLRKKSNEPGYYSHLNNACIANFTGHKRKIKSHATQRFFEVERVIKKFKINGEVGLKI
jgi:hypothetical protein